MALDPVKSHTDRLFLFWQSYENEAELLKEWHLSASNLRSPDGRSPPRSTGNVLYDSFLDTWGKGIWEFEDDSVPWKNRSYFAALGVVSDWLRKQCHTVLNEILVADGKKFKVPLQLKVDPSKADETAKKKIHELFSVFDGRELPSLKRIDICVKAETKPPEKYLEALNRMMEIETRCFEIQRNFLAEGTILPESA